MRSSFRVVPAVLLLAIVGCNSNSSTPTATNTSTSNSAASGSPPPVTVTSGEKISIALLPKIKGIAYFTSCAKGAEEAAKELGDVEVIYDGPTDGSPEKAAEMIEKWTLKGVKAIAVAPNDPQVLAPAMKAAKEAGIKVLTWDADGDKNAREWFVNQASAVQIANALVDTMAKDSGGKGKYAIITATLTAANQNEWMKHMKVRLKKYPEMQLVATKPSNEDQKLAFSTAQDLMKAYPDLKGIWGISSVSFPGAAEAVKQAGKNGKVFVTGLSMPEDMKTYVKGGTVKSVILWNTLDLGYLTIHAARAAVKGDLKSGAKIYNAGRLGDKKIVGDNILLGDILIFTKENIDKYDF
jgi:ABC-type sugar transport system substrate-binding protein